MKELAVFLTAFVAGVFAIGLPPTVSLCVAAVATVLVLVFGVTSRTEAT